MPTAAFSYGFGEGPWHSRQKFEAKLERAGFDVIRDIPAADIIISHSAGCYFLPEMTDKQILFLIDPPYWPGRSSWNSFIEKVRTEFIDARQRRALGFWLRKTAWNITYSLRSLTRTLTIARLHPLHNFHEALEDHDIVLIRNDRDVWCTPEIEKLPTKGKSFLYYHVPGLHDDLWEMPAPYVAIIQEVATLRP
ncbi:MAG: hypothetical protein JWM37_242 [Candidatus Saccharibacteria bacterium]|nr:hypothetical protein [Candidatus Saccharibacteria bacterium]